MEIAGEWNGRFRIHVTCAITSGTDVKTYLIESLACNATTCDETTGGAANYVERKLSVTAEGPL